MGTSFLVGDGRERRSDRREDDILWELFFGGNYTKCKFCIIRRTIPTDLSGLRSVLSLKSPNPRPPSDLSHNSGTPRIPDISQLSTLNSDEARGQSLIRGLLIVYHALVISVISVASISFSTVMNPLTRSGGLLAVCCPYCYLQM